MAKKRKPNHPVRLTVASIQKYQPGVVRREFYDTGAPGLTLIVEVSGRKSFAFRAKAKKKTLGPVDLSGTERCGVPPVGSPHTLSQARAAVAALQQRIQAGEDVFSSGGSKGTGRTYPEAVKQYITNARAVGPRSKGWQDSARVLGLAYGEIDATPIPIPGGLAERWATKEIGSITVDDLHDLVAESITTAIPGKPPRVKKHSNGRGRIMAADLSACFRWLFRKRWLKDDIAHGLDKPQKFEARDRALTGDELRKVLLGAQELGEPWRTFVFCLAVLGQRRREVSNMTWAELDLDKAVWNLPASRTKNARAHTVPLPPLVAELLGTLPKRGEFVFTTNGHDPVSGFSDLKERLDGAIGPIAPWRLHDLRRTMVTGSAELGVAPHHIEAIVNHVSGHKASVAGVYNRATYDGPKRAGLERWAGHVQALLDPEQRSNVVELHASA
jgi:integrase